MIKFTEIQHTREDLREHRTVDKGFWLGVHGGVFFIQNIISASKNIYKFNTKFIVKARTWTAHPENTTGRCGGDNISDNRTNKPAKPYHPRCE